MKKLNFVELKTTKKGIERRVIYTWHDVTERNAKIICRNFIDGFVLGYRGDMRVDVLTYGCQQWRYHDSIGYFRWQFENGKHKIIKV